MFGDVVVKCDRTGVRWFYRANDYRSIYSKMMELTGNDHHLSENVASWCELASYGEVYEFENGEVEIQERY